MSALYQNDTIRIRPYQDGDADKLLECILSSHEDFARYLPWVSPNFGRDDCELWMQWTGRSWQVGVQYDLVIERIEDERFLGGIGLLDINLSSSSASLGYFMRNDAAGKGYTTAAARLAVQFAQDLGLSLVNIYVATDNVASMRVAEKLGGKLQAGILENYEQVNGRIYDSYHYILALNAAC